MGISEEWLDPVYLGFDPVEYDALERTFIQKASTENGRFAVKLFPRHLHWSKEKFGKDFLFEIRKKHELGIIVLERRDRVRQAISFYRARMSGLWTSRDQGREQPLPYDFAEICQAYFQIEQSYAFWKAYLKLSELDFRQFYYEDLLHDPQPYIEAVAGFMDVPAAGATPVSELRIQRDSLTEDWSARFRKDATAKGAAAGLQEMPVARTLGNLARFALKRPLARKHF
ncbi:Stf0 family sulfotransferase [Mesorhizobium sp.]|uniref:Stf0 family sulfotransferase n=1 Tax=Mesorhizobium sp. TaxID=1871066 RepID=UPI003BA8EC61